MNGKNMQSNTQIPTDKEILDWLEVHPHIKINYKFATFRTAVISEMIKDKLKELTTRVGSYYNPTDKDNEEFFNSIEKPFKSLYCVSGGGGKSVLKEKFDQEQYEAEMAEGH